MLGNNFLKKVLTLLLILIFNFNLGEKYFFVKKYKNMNCNIPDNVTAQDKKYINWSSKIFPNKRTAIKRMFKIMGAAEAIANLLFEFNIAEKKDAKLINNKKGKVILVKVTANSIFE